MQHLDKELGSSFETPSIPSALGKLCVSFEGRAAISSFTDLGF
jgi:hypothetical protein